MTTKRILLGLIFLDFVAFTGYVLFQHGLMGFVELATANLVSIQLTLDLVIALGFVLTWLVRDARRTGRNWVPYVIATFCVGSIAPMAYLLLDSRSHVGR